MAKLLATITRRPQEDQRSRLPDRGGCRHGKPGVIAAHSHRAPRDDQQDTARVIAGAQADREPGGEQPEDQPGGDYCGEQSHHTPRHERAAPQAHGTRQHGALSPIIAEREAEDVRAENDAKADLFLALLERNEGGRDLGAAGMIAVSN